MYSNYKIISKSKKIINLLPIIDKTKNSNKILKVKIPLKSYFKIIKKIGPNKNAEIKNKIKMTFSINAYQSFIKKLLDELDINHKIIINNDNYIAFGDVENFENKLLNLKKIVLSLMAEKHYLLSFKEKIKLIEENNLVVEKKKNKIYDLFIKIKNKNISNELLLNILKKYEKISNRDIKIAKYYYLKNKKDENNNKANNINNNNNNNRFNIMKNIGSMILPLFYIANYYNSFQKE